MRKAFTTLGVLVFIGGLLAVSFALVSRATAMPVADFAPPATAARAAEIVREAQAAQAAVQLPAQQQQSINPGVLPLMPTIYFEQTGHHLSNRAGFLDFWRANGRLLMFGYPITEEIVENGRIVQYFERARFEYHAATTDAPASVQLGLLGSEMLAMQGIPASIDDPQTGVSYFPETRHTLWGEFKHYWQKRGGIEIFGYPLSEVVDENGRQVQYFERAKMIYNPEDMEWFFRSAEAANGFNLNTLREVEVSDLGRQVAQLRGIDINPTPQLPGATTWHKNLWSRHISVDLSRQWLTAYEGDLIVYDAPVATGRDGFNTPTGEYAIYDRYKMQTMIGNMGGESWNVPNIPWVQYIVGGVALHGTYWHDAHGTGVRMSHGCINLKIDDAHWLYDWADIGTTVSIHY